MSATKPRCAFQYLLAETARSHHLLLVPEQSTRSGGKRVVPDGTLCDDFNLHRGYWEAKDTEDNLDADIAKKIKKGYPLGNIIFEDTRQAVLFQGKREVLRIELARAAKRRRSAQPVLRLHRAGTRGLRQGGRGVSGSRSRSGVTRTTKVRMCL
jgi:hypothetical protein